MNGFENTLEWIGGASLQLLIAAAVAWLLCVTVARKSSTLKHAIWVIVLLKCVVPPTVTAPWSLGKFVPVGQASPDAAASDIEQRTSRATTGWHAHSEAVGVEGVQQDQLTTDHALPSGSGRATQTDENVARGSAGASPSQSLEDSTDRATVLRTVPSDANRVSVPESSNNPAQHGSQNRGTMTETLEGVVAPSRQAMPDLQSAITPAEAFRKWWMGTISVASLMAVWIIGAMSALAIACLSIARVAARIRRGRTIDEGPAAIAVEEAAIALGLKRPPALVSTDETTTPFVAGLFRPTVVIPQSILDSLPADELRLVVWHEVVHVARRDAWTSLLQLFSVALFWFHPAVWWAAGAVRREREACCDETVLRTSKAEPSTYGDAFLHVLSAVRGRAIAAPAWAAPAGVFERDSDLRSRIEQIMNFRPQRSKRLQAGLIATLFALAVIPMGSRASDPWANVDEDKIPSVVSVSPASGNSNVDPATNAITVTFDRPMAEGFSFTGGGPEFPKSPSGTQPAWSDDKKVCTLPVELKAGKFYRFGINSKSFRNFQSADGVPVKPIVVTFTTKGANAATVGRMDAPKIVAIDPPNGATDVHPLTTKEIRVTFDRPMGDGMSWVGGGESFPRPRIGAPAHWLPNSRTCVMPLDLDYGREYRVSLNSDRFKNFQSTAGVPSEPFEYSFTTVAKETAATLLSTSFEERFSGPGDPDGDYQDHLRTTDDASDGKTSLRLGKLDKPIRWPKDAGPDAPVSILHHGTNYIHTQLLPVPKNATELEIGAMIRAERVKAANATLTFFELTPSARAGKEVSYFTVYPPGVEDDEDAPMRVLFVGRAGDSDPPADHGWALYQGRVDVPERAELVQFSIQLDEGDALWIDELEIKVRNDQRKPPDDTPADSANRSISSDQFVGQASPDAAASDMLLRESSELFHDDFNANLLSRCTPCGPETPGEHRIYWSKQSDAEANRFIEIRSKALQDLGAEDITDQPRTTSNLPGVRGPWVDLPDDTRRLRVSVKARRELNAVGHVRVAFLLRHAMTHRPAILPMTPLVIDDSLDETPVGANEWKTYSAFVNVTSDAYKVTVEPALARGDGIAYDDVVVEVVPAETQPISDVAKLLEEAVLETELEILQAKQSRGDKHPEVIRLYGLLNKLRAKQKEIIDRSETDKPADPLSVLPDPSTLDLPTEPARIFDDFEWIPEKGLPLPWRGNSRNGADATIDRTTGHSGKISLKLDKTANDYFPIVQWAREIDHTEPDARQVKLKAFVKADGARKAVLDVLFLGENGKWIKHQWVDYIGDHRSEWLLSEGRWPPATSPDPSSKGATHDWQPYSGLADIPEGTAKIVISAQMYGPGTIWVDDVEVQYVGINPKLPSDSRY